MSDNEDVNKALNWFPEAEGANCGTIDFQKGVVLAHSYRLLLAELAAVRAELAEARERIEVVPHEEKCNAQFRADIKPNKCDCSYGVHGSIESYRAERDNYKARAEKAEAILNVWHKRYLRNGVL